MLCNTEVLRRVLVQTACTKSTVKFREFTVDAIIDPQRNASELARSDLRSTQSDCLHDRMGSICNDEAHLLRFPCL